MCGPVFCPCLSVSVYVRLCLLCALCLFVFIVFMCWSSLHMVANSQVLESATSTIMSGNSSHLGVCTTSLQSQQFQLFAPKLSQEFGIDLSKAVQFSRRMKSCKKNVQSVTHHILYTCPLSLSASPLQPFHAIRLDYPRGHSHST